MVVILRPILGRHAMAKVAPKKDEHRQPDFVLRAKNENGFWTTIGAMWSADLGDKGKGWSIKINSAPIGWKGDCLAMEPLPPKEEA